MILHSLRTTSIQALCLSLIACCWGYLPIAEAAHSKTQACEIPLVQSGHSWTKALESLNQNLDRSSYMAHTMGQWIQVDGDLFHYHISGKGRKVHVRLGGLGDSLTRAVQEQNGIYKHLMSQNYRILTLEYAGQGDVEVLRAHEKGQKIISHSQLIEASNAALMGIAEINGLSLDDFVSASGLSFGGQTLAGLHLQKSLVKRVVLISTGVKNYNHFLFSAALNHTVDTWRTLSDYFSGGSTERLNRRRLESFFAQTSPQIANDPVLLQAKSALTMGAEDVNVEQVISSITSPTELIIISALKDLVVPGMLHFELAMAAIENPNVKVRLVLVEDIGHHIPAEASRPVARALARTIADRQFAEQEALVISPRGSVRNIDFVEAERLLKEQSRFWWEHIKAYIKGSMDPLSSSMIQPPPGWLND